MPGGGAALGERTCAARAKVRYGALLRITAQGAAISSPFMITADARVVASFAAYFGLARKVRSPGPASSIFATRRISIAASPSIGHSKRRASSPSVTTSRISPCRALALCRHALDEQCHFRQMQAVGDLEDHAVPG